jgi:hypothetical protein
MAYHLLLVTYGIPESSEYPVFPRFDTRDDDDTFVVLTETKFSICYIPVWARYSPLLTRVKAHAITLSP